MKLPRNYGEWDWVSQQLVFSGCVSSNQDVSVDNLIKRYQNWTTISNKHIKLTIWFMELVGSTKLYGGKLKGYRLNSGEN